MRRHTALWCLIAIAAACWFARIGYDRTVHGFTDWVFFEVGARVLVHYQHQSIYGGDRWHLYVDNVDLQIGPPAFWAVAAFEWLPVRTIYNLFSVLLAVIAVGAVGAAALAGHWAKLPVRQARSLLVRHGRTAAFGAAATATSAITAFQCVAWKHLDDALALMLAALAACLVARGRAWWLVGILLGTAAATKPWAMILVPMLLGLPRRDIARTVLVAIAVAMAWWAPFVISAPNTIQALGHFNVFSRPGSVLHLVGIHGQVQHWLRPVQFTIGIAAGCLAVRQRGWTAAPLAALATRVLTDPYAYGYYGLGPLLFALFYDWTGEGFGGLPTFTLMTAFLEFGIPYTGAGPTWTALAKLVWSLAVLVATLLPRRTAARQSDVGGVTAMAAA
ncbi:MAG TPA: hypothetical protein VHB69_01760 [Mycobacteriales bacterium]|nr:hypothetical protein [Mycobacteriales bacterium]